MVCIYIVMETSYNAVVNDSKDGQIGALETSVK